MKNMGGMLFSAVVLTFGVSTAMADTAKYAVAMSERSYLSEIDRAFFEAAKKEGVSDITFRAFFDSSLGTFQETFELVSQGAIEMGAVVTGYHPSELTLFSVTNALPAVFKDGKQAVATTQSLAEEIQAVEAELDRNGLVPLLYRPLPQYRIMCTKPVKTLADLEGRKVRTYGAYIPKMFESVGAIPVNVGLPEFYEALERGTINCGYFTYALFKQFKIHEVAPYISDLEFGAINGYTVFANKTWWESLPDETRSRLRIAAKKAEEAGFEIVRAEEEKALRAMITEGGTLVEFSEKDELYARLPDMLDLWVQASSAKAKGVQETADLIRKSVNR